MLPECYLKYIDHDDAKYEEWENLYMVEATIPEDFDFNSVNERPSVDRPAVIPVIPMVRLERIWNDSLNY